jgi:hypothetical protein
MSMGSVFTVITRGLMRAGGGTGLSVVRSRLEPSAEYEYVCEDLKFTWAANETGP